MMILAILSHGGNGNVYTSDGRNVRIESIYEKFNNQFCPLLKGKPKFFIIQVKLMPWNFMTLQFDSKSTDTLKSVNPRGLHLKL